MSETIFTEPTSPDAAPVVQTPTTPTLPPEVAEMVGQGKKYSSVEDALKSVPHAQKHIKTLEEELAQAKAELEKRKTAEQILSEIKSGNQQTETPSGNIVTPDIVAQLVEQSLAQNMRRQTEAQNTNQVVSAFKAKFGEKAEEVYNTAAAESGLTVEQFNNLAKTSPALVLKLVGLDGKRNDTPPVGKSFPSVRSEAQTQAPGTEHLTARVKQGASTKDLVNAWKIAGQKVGKQS